MVETNEKKIVSISLILAFILSLFGCYSNQPPVDIISDSNSVNSGITVQEDIIINEYGEYVNPDDVALYIHTYDKLPSNYITKQEAMDLGWLASKGNLWDVTDSKSIGGDRFGNREGLLPDAEGRIWYECDVNYAGGYRGEERTIFSNDGLIYYTNNHYESFEQYY